MKASYCKNITLPLVLIPPMTVGDAKKQSYFKTIWTEIVSIKSMIGTVSEEPIYGPVVI